MEDFDYKEYERIRLATTEQCEMRLKELDVSRTLDTFTSKISGRLDFWSNIAIVNGRIFERFSGDFISLGNFNWILAGTAYGRSYRDHNVETAFNIEFDSSTDSILWTILNNSKTFSGVSQQNASIQVRSDVTTRSMLLVCRANRVQFNNQYFIENGSYIQVGF